MNNDATPRRETLARQLAIGVEQLQHLGKRARQLGVTADDFADLADYLRELGEHGQQMARMAVDAIDDAARSHPVLSTRDGLDVQAYLSHAEDLFDAAQTFAADTYARASQWRPGAKNPHRNDE